MQPNFVSKAVVTGTVALAALLAASPIRSAEPSAPSQQQDSLLQQLDTDRDGRVSRTEADAVKGVATAFAQADENKDGYLSADEFVKARAIYDRMRVAQFATDSTITAKVKTALLTEAELNPFAVTVRTEDGRVVLSGVVKRPEQATRAEQIAASISGVVGVKNSLEVK